MAEVNWDQKNLIFFGGRDGGRKRRTKDAAARPGIGRAAATRTISGLRQAQLCVFRHHDLPALAFMPVENAQYFMYLGIGIAPHAAVIDYDE
jgi:hypothetical protein